MSHMRKAATALCAASTFLVAAAAVAQDAEALYRRCLDAILTTPFEAKGTLESTAGTRAEFRLRRSVQDGVMRTWIEVEKPADAKGQRFLLWNRPDGTNEGWWYDPKTRKVKEIEAQSWREPFLRSEFSLGDLLFVGTAGHNFEVGGEESYGGQSFWVVHVYAKDKSAALYPHRVYSLDVRQNILMRALYFDASDKPVKRWIAERIERHGSEWFPVGQKVHRVGAGQQSSSLLLSDLRYEPELPANAFDPAGLAPSPVQKKKE